MFGLETAFKDLQHGGKRIIYDNPFIHGQRIPINGLIWMGDSEFMHEQIKEKIGQGFSCLKLKIGGLDFRTECDVIESIRKEFSEDLTIRLDANGSFKSEEALEKLRILSDYNIHSIEQPLPVDSPALRNVCEHSSIPIALDEELIAHVELNAKISLLERVRPHYIILKPTLHGGMKGCREWISVAEQLGIAWWITSALESNIGLNAICQFTAEYDVELPQGLGTGAIYTDNIGSPLMVRAGHIYIDDRKSWDAL